MITTGISVMDGQVIRNRQVYSSDLSEIKNFEKLILMTYYIILQPSIRSMGGEEMYTRNKVISARQKGYTPIVFHSGIGGKKIYIDDLKPFDQYEFPEFRYEPCVVSDRKKRKLFNRVQSIIKDIHEDSIIESHELLVAEWGEWLASQFKIRHFAYILLEHNTITNNSVYDFFRYKYERRELAGIVKETIPDMFINFSKDVEGYFLPAYCTNVYENIPCNEKYKVGPADYTIGSIGRTNKQCVQPMVEAIIRFVSSHLDKSFNVLYVGGSMDKASEKLVVKRLSSLPNVKLYFTGMIFPISVEMVQQMDVCISTAGSCRVSRNCGIPTVPLDGNDSKAIGVFGKTTEKSLFRSPNEPPIEIEDILEEILIEGKYKKENYVELVDVDFEGHWDFIQKMSKEKGYYDINNISFPWKRRLLARFLGFYYGLIPGSLLSRLIQKVISMLFRFR